MSTLYFRFSRPLVHRGDPRLSCFLRDLLRDRLTTGTTVTDYRRENPVVPPEVSDHQSTKWVVCVWGFLFGKENRLIVHHGYLYGHKEFDMRRLGDGDLPNNSKLGTWVGSSCFSLGDVVPTP